MGDSRKRSFSRSQPAYGFLNTFHLVFHSATLIVGGGILGRAVWSGKGPVYMILGSFVIHNPAGIVWYRDTQTMCSEKTGTMGLCCQTPGILSDHGATAGNAAGDGNLLHSFENHRN